MTRAAQRESRFRSALRRNTGLTIGTWVKLPVVESVEMAAGAGFDFIVIDLEHSPMNLETAFRHVGAALQANLSPIVRVPALDGGVVSRLLDAGADGIMLPHVDTVADAEDAVAAMRFPPIGDRGMGPTSRAGDWGLLPYDEYVRFGQEEASLIVQIESELAVRNAGDIAAVAGVDALLIGSTDLARSAGLAPGGAELAELMATTVEASRASGTPIGNAGAATGEAAQDALDRGFAFSVMSNDATLLATSLRAAAEAGRSATAEPATTQIG
ncbi:MAG: HpcH/HpaI aldolase family protein [Pseudoclavibacter sp.]